ncbi:uncharacterized protein LOC132061426 [Lycium ferocissimum]|uniref:uncharacterized protein LOC132061426 n=1 Tax=Lycium ferocissimum TaxID=112874 RepID=UPI0028167041|nr:uncharacterized protein LOC132061426 [Lycium ferocissimum]
MAMNYEFDALIKNKTWELVPRPPNVNVIRSMWIFTHKEKSNGDFERHKAGLVGDDSLDAPLWLFFASEFAEGSGSFELFPWHSCPRHKDGMFFRMIPKYAKEIIDTAGMSSCKATFTLRLILNRR